MQAKEERLLREKNKKDADKKKKVSLPPTWKRKFKLTLHEAGPPNHAPSSSALNPNPKP